MFRLFFLFSGNQWSCFRSPFISDVTMYSTMYSSNVDTESYVDTLYLALELQYTEDFHCSKVYESPERAFFPLFPLSNTIQVQNDPNFFLSLKRYLCH